IARVRALGVPRRVDPAGRAPGLVPRGRRRLAPSRRGHVLPGWGGPVRPEGPWDRPGTGNRRRRGRHQRVPRNRGRLRHPGPGRGAVNTRFEHSAGGVVLRPGPTGPEVVLASRRTMSGGLAWGLPK